MRELFLASILLGVQLPALAQGVTVERAITYAEVKGRPLKLDLYLPEGEGPHPFVLVIHGGGWCGGFRSLGDAPFFAHLLARRGIAAASLTYRLAPRDPHPAQIEDCRRALQFLRHHAKTYGLDPARAGAMGASSGGHLAALLGTQDDAADPKSEDSVARESTRVRAVVAICAPMALELDPEEPPTLVQVDLVQSFLGTRDLKGEEALAEILRRARDASPITYLDAKDAHLVLIHGKSDSLVPVSQSRKMAKAAEKAGAPVILIEVPGGHGEWLPQANPRDGHPPAAWWTQALGILDKALEHQPPEAVESKAR